MKEIFIEFENKAGNAVYVHQKTQPELQAKLEQELRLDGYIKTGRVFRIAESLREKIQSLPQTYEEIIFRSADTSLVRFSSDFGIPIYRICDEKNNNSKVIFQSISFEATRKNFNDLISNKKITKTNRRNKLSV